MLFIRRRRWPSARWVRVFGRLGTGLVLLTIACAREASGPEFVGAPAPHESLVAATASGISGYRLVSAQFTVGSTAFQHTANVQCPTGSRALSGGLENGTSGLYLQSNHPDYPVGSGWRVTVWRPRPKTALSFTVWVVCAATPPGYALTSQLFSLGPSDRQRLGAVYCPAGLEPLGGGVENNSPHQLGNILIRDSYSMAAYHSWRFSVSRDVTGTTAAVRGWVVCAARPLGYTEVWKDYLVGKTVLTLTGISECASGKRALGGGVQDYAAWSTVGTFETGFRIQATRPYPTLGDGWTFTEFRPTAGTRDALLRAVALCAEVSTEPPPPPPPPPSLGVTISGPTSVRPFSACLYEAQASGGTEPYDYAWTVDGVPAGENSRFYRHQTDWGAFQLGVTVTDAGSVARSNTLGVLVDPGAPECLDQ